MGLLVSEPLYNNASIPFDSTFWILRIKKKTFLKLSNDIVKLKCLFDTITSSSKVQYT